MAASNVKIHRVICSPFTSRRWRIIQKLGSKRNRIGGREHGHRRGYIARSSSVAARKRRVRCSLCGKVGFNRRTCYKGH